MKRKYDKFMEEMIDKVAEMEASTGLLTEQYNYFLRKSLPRAESEQFLKKLRRQVRTVQTMTKRAKLVLICIERDGKIEKDFQN